MKRRAIFGLTAMLMAVTAPTTAETVVEMHKVNEKGISTRIGKVKVAESRYGVVFTPSLQDLPSGQHGFHVHQNPDCSPGVKDGKAVPAGTAGDHYDPRASKRHDTPWGQGHLGDLPSLYVDKDGKATQPVLAPRLKMHDLQGRALVIHSGGDNFSDQPNPLGGGGARIACGVIDARKIAKE